MATAITNLPQSAKMTAKWEWTTSASSGRWSNPQQAIKPLRVFSPTSEENTLSDYQPVLHSKLKVRGQGRALTIRFESEEGKDFSIFGWSIPFTGETTR